MPDSTTNGDPAQPQPNSSEYSDAMAIVNPDDHHDADANGDSLAPADSTDVEKTADTPSDYHQDIAPINGASTNADTIPTPALGATTPAPAPAAVSSAATGSPARAPTPGKADSSNAAAAAAAVVMPAEPAINGAPTRVYLNTKVTQHVLEGMKLVALKKPDQPLRVLGEFLLQRSQEFENTPIIVDPEEDKHLSVDDSMKDIES